MRQDFYSVLGVAPTASMDDIRQAFRQLAKQYHPDAGAQSDASTADRFKQITEAYSVLGTPQLRAAYDRAVRSEQPVLRHEGRGMGIPSLFRRRTSAPDDEGPAAGPGEAANASSHASSHAEAASAEVGDDGQSRGTGLAAVRMSIIPGESSIVAPRALTRFYLLSELGSAQTEALLSPPALDLALVIDHSSSMKGAKLFETKRALQELLHDIRDDDLLTVVFFSDRADVVADGETVAGRPGIEVAVSQVIASGSTHIGEGLEATLQRLESRQNRSRVRSLVLLTDGMTYGDEERCVALAERARRLGFSITALGVGTEWNRELLDRLAAISGGSSHYVEKPQLLSPVFADILARSRATLAADMRLTFAPAEGVLVARATRIAPDIAEAFPAPAGERQVETPARTPVHVELGPLVGRPDLESAVVLWEVLLDPQTFRSQDGYVTLGTLYGEYWTSAQPRQHLEQMESAVRIPLCDEDERGSLHPDVRLAIELMTAFRLQSRADLLVSTGQVTEAAARLHTSALRLRAAGAEEHASRAMEAALQVSAAQKEGTTTALRVKYDVKNLSVFHRMRAARPTR